jgi:predicted TIM-barrel fold metal-dependent hydrolase
MAISRRELLAAAALALGARAQGARPKGYLVDWGHMFGTDLEHFPYSKYAPYQPTAKPVEAYCAFCREAQIDHSLIVHSEIYQDDHRYLEYCFEHEHKPGFFKSTCLFDPVADDTPERIEQIYRKYPTRIIGMRINVLNERGTPSTATGGVRNRDLRNPNMKKTWKKLADLGLSAEMQSLPWHAPIIKTLKSEFPDIKIEIDHYGQPARGTEAEYKDVLALGRLPNVYMWVEPLNRPNGRRSYGWSTTPSGPIV